MATITKMHNKSGIRWKALVRRGSRSRSKTFRLKSSAKAWAEEIERGEELSVALGSPGAVIPFADLAEEYMNQYVGKDHSRKYRVDFWVKELGKTRLTDIKPRIIKASLDRYQAGSARGFGGIGPDLKPFTRSLNKPRSVASRNRHKAALGAVLNFARDREYIRGELPTNSVQILKEDNQRQRFLSKGEAKKLFIACRNSEWDRLYLLVRMLLTTGARLGEVLYLKWGEIDFQRKQVYRKTSKNGEPRILILDPVIDELGKFHGAKEQLVFPGKRLKYKPYNFRRVWEKALKDSGIEDMKPNDLRHSTASFLLDAGYTLEEIAKVLGHKNVQTTRRYAHLDISRKRAMVNEVFAGIQ